MLALDKSSDLLIDLFSWATLTHTISTGSSGAFLADSRAFARDRQYVEIRKQAGPDVRQIRSYGRQIF
jgi:hypothetical protein